LQKTMRIVLVLVLIFLVIAGLNISNQGINKLSMEDRGAVAAIYCDKNDIELELMGKEYSYRHLLDEYSYLIEKGKEGIRDINAYFIRMCRILKAVFL